MEKQYKDLGLYYFIFIGMLMVLGYFVVIIDLYVIFVLKKYLNENLQVLFQYILEVLDGFVVKDKLDQFQIIILVRKLRILCKVMKVEEWKSIEVNDLWNFFS